DYYCCSYTTSDTVLF
nr:immunoglobulin light chain junction region [Macaca mulatta]MOY16116.1 immunoglobulin light chain junction region [Macaca mulatta]MOY16145.1 immunoglobulin light chain junction region [Macaca mulatta]MOY16361.1 immunoglobulin light chain junction region [Macaca mulatta]MOY16431.1 immunoglobulin light chain junction region [Macaca mulatta]